MVGLGVGLEVRRAGGEKEVLTEDLEVDIRFEVSKQTYGLECDRGLYFHQAVP